MRPWREGGTSLAETARLLKMGIEGHCQRVWILETGIESGTYSSAK